MLDLKIAPLNLNIENAAGQEHRIQPIAGRHGPAGRVPLQTLI
jgi:hypothetical protein